MPKSTPQPLHVLLICTFLGGNEPDDVMPCHLIYLHTPPLFWDARALADTVNRIYRALHFNRKLNHDRV
jgi:hypothetical protein